MANAAVLGLKECDVWVEDQGSIILVIPQNQQTRDWFKDHVHYLRILQGFIGKRSPSSRGCAVAVEPRFLSTLLEGLEEEGFTVSAEAGALFKIFSRQ